MVMRYNRLLGIILGLFIVITNIWLAGCSSENKEVSNAKNYNDLVRILNDKGYKANDLIESKDDGIFLSLFTVKPKKLFVYYDDARELLNVYEFDDNRTADTEAKTISRDGKKIGSLLIGGENHFYKQGNIIVQYSGSNKPILNILENTMYKLS